VSRVWISDLTGAAGLATEVFGAGDSVFAAAIGATGGAFAVGVNGTMR
jgi:hypothetical protein